MDLPIHRTLTERMARAGHEEALAHWMPLSTWLAMALFDLLLPKIMDKPPTSTSKVYPKIIEVEAASKMEEAASKTAAAIKGDGLNGHESVGVDDSIADLMELLSGIWLMKIGITGFKEEPLPAWLKSYLIDPKENESYDATPFSPLRRRKTYLFLT